MALDERAQRWFPVRNGTTETIPPFAIMRIVPNYSAVVRDKVVLTVVKPNRRSEVAQDVEFHCVNGPEPIRSGRGINSHGKATQDWPATVLVGGDERHFANLDRVLIVADQWYVAKMRNVWFSTPALAALSAEQEVRAGRSRARVCMVRPTEIRLAAPPILLAIDHDAPLAFDYQQVRFGANQGWFRYGNFGYTGHSWGYGWAGWSGFDTLTGTRLPFGFAFRDAYSKIIHEGTAFDCLVGLIGQANPGFTDVGTYVPITLRLLVNDEEALTAEWRFPHHQTRTDEVELNKGDVVTVEAKIDEVEGGEEVAAADVGLRSVGLLLRPTISEDELGDE